MRCIEMSKQAKFERLMNQINRNMRCIEMKKMLSGRNADVRLIET